MVKAYLRYEAQATFGIIASSTANIVYDPTGKIAIAPALEEVILWDLKKGVEVGKWRESGNKSEVTCIAASPNKKDYAVGYGDGTIRIWNIKSSTSTVTLSGHRAAVTALAYDSDGTRLASGSKDTDLIIWDIISESGLYRLKGHKDQITCLAFLNTKQMEENDVGVSTEGYVLSSSKDTLIKLWDLSAQYCRETLVGHRSEVWSFAVSKDQKIIISGGAEAQLKAWKIDWKILGLSLEALGEKEKTSDDNMQVDITTPATLQRAINVYGQIPRQSRDRIVTIKFHPSGKYLGVQASDKSVELFKMRDHEQIRKKIQRRKKRAREKGKAETDISDEIEAEDEFVTEALVRTPAKVRSFDFAPVVDVEKAGQIQIVTSLSNNTIEAFTIPITAEKKTEESHEPSRLYSIDGPGHRSDIRSLALSSDDELLASASSNLLKIWNMKTRSCIRSIECGFALCSAFLPGNKHIIVGTKTGELELYDVGSSSLVESVKAHDGAIYSLQVRPDKRGFCTGSADKDVKFWDFDMVQDKNSPAKRLTFIHMRTLKMSDEVLCVRYSPDQNLLAVSLLDSTVKVFYHDTLKFFLSLYGHKLPVLSMDISSDNMLIATCSADKNVKLWGLDFGDCHKSLFAHQESVMAVQFVWGTHYFFTVSKDKTVKYWDGDKFENIMKLEGHHGEVWALAVSKHGSFVVTGSHDRSMRVWEKTDEQLFLEEEREKELEELYEHTLVSQMEKTNVDDGEVDAAGKQTMDTLKAGERLIEAMDIGDEEKNGWAAYENAKERGLPGQPPQRHPILMAMGDIEPDRYVLDVLKKIKANDIEEALMILPFSKVMSLFSYIESWAKKNWNIILVSRVLFSVVKTHHNQIVANRMMRPMLDSIRFHLRAQLQRQKDIMGYNRAALTYLQRDWKARNTSDFLDDSADSKPTDDEKKRKFVQLAS
ncbi:WD40-repeat-containing domain protein [Mucor mucedo]|uniref:WD40-repeat-containing domain protein n=1 Tax=Mucor mucedo TaxID=29922 RepID=UPI00221FD140|nr:WD40-repeat-containing domain protein [Mucor mucedo]KAI7888858.1 WD40-repeat-containing domain protein [Mucor mucedo]